MNTFKVLHITTETTWRGGENQVRYLMEGLREKGVLNYAALQPGARAHERYQALATIATFPMRNDLDLRAVYHLVRYVRQEGIHVIHAHTARAHSLALMAKMFLPQLVLIVHRRVESPLAGIGHRLKYLAKGVDAYITVSQKIGDDLLKGGVDPRKVNVVHSGIDEARFRHHSRDEARSWLAAELGDAILQSPLIVTAAHLTPTKGYPTLLKALALLKNEGRHFTSLILGEGGERQALETLHRDLGLGHSVRFMGFRQDVPKILCGADIMAHAAIWEGLGTAIVEGIFAGCALIASDVGGIPEIIKHERTGLLFPPGDEKALAQGLRRLLTDEALRSRLQADGLAWVRSHFSTKQMVEGNYQVYQRLLHQSGDKAEVSASQSRLGP